MIEPRVVRARASTPATASTILRRETSLRDRGPERGCGSRASSRGRSTCSGRRVGSRRGSGSRRAGSAHCASRRPSTPTSASRLSSSPRRSTRHGSRSLRSAAVRPGGRESNAQTCITALLEPTEVPGNERNSHAPGRTRTSDTRFRNPVANEADAALEAPRGSRRGSRFRHEPAMVVRATRSRSRRSRRWARGGGLAPLTAPSCIQPLVRLLVVGQMSLKLANYAMPSGGLSHLRPTVSTGWSSPVGGALRRAVIPGICEPMRLSALARRKRYPVDLPGPPPPLG